MIAVIDTNVFMAALLNPSGAPAKIRRRWRQRQFEVLISTAVLEEYADVLTHAPAIALNDAQFLIEEIEGFSRRIEISGALQACKDRDDDVFLETAVAGGADFSGYQKSQTLSSQIVRRRAYRERGHFSERA